MCVNHMELLPAPYIPVIAIFLIFLFSKAKFIASVYIFSLASNSVGPKILKPFFPSIVLLDVFLHSLL